MASHDGDRDPEDPAEEEPEADDAEYDSEEAAELGKAPPTKRQRVSKFLDIEAQDDEDDEDDDDDVGDLEDFIDDDAGATSTRAISSAEVRAIEARKERSHGRLDELIGLAEGADGEQELDAMLQQRYAQSAEAGLDQASIQHALYPSVSDTKLFTVKCKSGLERELAMRLLQKIFNCASIGKPLGVKSVIAVDNLREYIYVEAYRRDAVLALVTGVHDTYRSKISLVPLDQMAQVFRAGPPKEMPKPEQWAKFKRSEYSGDLCQVVSCDAAHGTVEVRLIPRVDYQLLAAGAKLPKGTRPPKRLFSIDECHKHHIQYKDEGQHYGVYDHHFEKHSGCLIKKVKLTALEWKNPDVSVEEINAFTQQTKLLAPAALQRPKAELKLGDHVKVTEGEQRGLSGRVVGITDDGKSLTLQPDAKFGPQVSRALLSFTESQLSKAFRPGDHVKCVTGTHVGVSGMVVRVADDKVTIFTDVTREQVTTYMSDITECFGAGSAGVERAGRSPVPYNVTPMHTPLFANTPGRYEESEAAERKEDDVWSATRVAGWEAKQEEPVFPVAAASPFTTNFPFPSPLLGSPALGHGL